MDSGESMCIVFGTSADHIRTANVLGVKETLRVLLNLTMMIQGDPLEFTSYCKHSVSSDIGSRDPQERIAEHVLYR